MTDYILLSPIGTPIRWTLEGGLSTFDVVAKLDPGADPVWEHTDDSTTLDATETIYIDREPVFECREGYAWLESQVFRLPVIDDKTVDRFRKHVSDDEFIGYLKMKDVHHAARAFGKEHPDALRDIVGRVMFLYIMRGASGFDLSDHLPPDPLRHVEQTHAFVPAP